MTPPSPRAAWLPGALVAAVTLLAFLPTFSNGFVNWDDAENFLRNPDYRGLGWANLRWMFTSTHMGHYIPVTWLTLGLDYLLWGMNPAGYHATSIVLHSLNALLVYLVAARLYERSEPGPAAPGGLRLGAAVAALLFSVHPLRVESVAWVTERRDLVAGLFALLTVLAYLAASGRGAAGRLHPGWRWAAVGLFALALLSKSIVVGLPLVLLVLDVYPLRRMVPGQAGWASQAARLLGEKAPFLALSVLVGGLMLILGARRGVLTPLETLGVAERLAISGYGLAFYLWKTLLPWPLSPFYELRYPVAPLSATYLLPAVAVLALTALAVAARRRWPALLAAWLAYVIILVPVIGIAHNGMQITADRYSYLAGLGWALLAGAAVAWVWRAGRAGAVPSRLARLVAGLAAVAIVAFGGLTTLQIRLWGDSERLWRHAIRIQPDSAFSHYHLGGALAEEGRTEEARVEFERAVGLVPDRLPYAKAVFLASLGLLLQQQGDLAGAERSYRTALRFSEDNVVANNNLGVILASRGEFRAALDSFRHVLRVTPGFPGACINARLLAERLAVVPPELGGCRTSEPGEGAAPRPQSPLARRLR